jgi:hypothetical protein
MPPTPDYKSFWPVYLAAHSQPATRLVHLCGTGLAIVLLLAAILLRNPWLVLAAILTGYAFAWFAHGVVEHNKPATFGHPFWSIFSDFRMLFLWLAGRLDSELTRHGITPINRTPN